MEVNPGSNHDSGLSFSNHISNLTLQPSKRSCSFCSDPIQKTLYMQKKTKAKKDIEQTLVWQNTENVSTAAFRNMTKVTSLAVIQTRIDVQSSTTRQGYFINFCSLFEKSKNNKSAGGNFIPDQ